MSPVLGCSILTTSAPKSANTMVPVDLKVHVRSCREVDFEYYIGGSIEEKSVEYTKFFNTIEPLGMASEDL